jgi:hypothetical protein
MKIRPVGAEFFCGRIGRNDTTKQIVGFRNFANVPKIKIKGMQYKEVPPEVILNCFTPVQYAFVPTVFQFSTRSGQHFLAHS